MRSDKNDFAKLVCYALLACAGLAWSSLNVYPQNVIEISGYLVDANDKPLRNGSVTVYYDPPVPPASWEQLTVSWKPLEDGLFGVQVPWKPGRTIRLLIEDRPEGFYPIRGEDMVTLRHLFKNIVVVSKFSKTRDLDKVKNYVQYGQAVLDFTDCPASVLNKILTNGVFLKVRGPDLRVLTNTSFASYFEKDSKTLVVNLPEGTWQLELADTLEGRIILPWTAVVIAPPAVVAIKVRNGRDR